MIGENLKRIRQVRGLNLTEVANKSGLSLGYLNNLEKNTKKNPTRQTLEKLATALECTVDDLIYEESYSESELDKTSYLKEDATIHNVDEFNNAKDALNFIYKQPAILGYNGFDIERLSDKEIIDFANELLNQMRLLTYKYKK